MDDTLVEEWVAAQVLAYQSLASSERWISPEEFTARATQDERPRSALLERLRLLRRLESGFQRLREETLGPGTELDDFEIGAPLGSGGMGRVFRARQRSVAREVALKVPHRGAALEPAASQRFLREAQAVAQLRHPNIVPLLQIGEHAGAPFLVFELSEGRSLRAVLGELAAGRLPRTGASLGRPDEPWERAALGVVASMLDALGAAHEAGIVHRDVKPGNVLLEHDGRVRVVDFGLARRLDQDTLTESKELVGTVSYMAPEVVRSSHAAGPWSDVWSAGIVLYELLTLRRPFDGDTALDTLRRIESEELAPLQVTDGLARPLSAIVEKALSREIATRYASARELGLDLRSYLDGREVSARPSTGLSRLGRRLNRHPGMAAVSVALALVLGLLAGVWRSGGEVRAQVRLASAEDITREALLWWYADAGPSGKVILSTTARRLAVEKLETALQESPDLVEARVELAQYAAMLGDDERALELIEGLEADGLHLRSLAWTRAGLRDPSRNGIRPDPGEELDLANVADLDRLAWSRYLLRQAKNQLALEVLRPIDAHGILGCAAKYGQFEAYYTRGWRDPLLALSRLEATLVTSPEHPLPIANLCGVLVDLLIATPSDDVLTELERQAKRNLLDEGADLLPALVRAEASAPWLSTLWHNHTALLGVLGRHDEGIEVASAGLERHPDGGHLADQLSQAYFTRWSFLEAPVPEELEVLRVQLEASIASDPSAVQNLWNLAYVHYHLDHAEDTLVWVERAQSEYLAHAPSTPRTEWLRGICDEMAAWAIDKIEGEEAQSAEER